VGGIGSTIAGWSMIFMTFAYGCTGLIVSWSVLCVSLSICCNNVSPFLPATSPGRPVSPSLLVCARASACAWLGGRLGSSVSAA
jgi:hypothetical protein